MSKKHFWKRGIAAACAVVTAATGLALPVFAADTSGIAVTPKVVALGDDCLAEVSGSESAVSYMADYLGGNAVNYAAVGTTSGKLVSDLQSDQNMKRDVQTADVVMISVGVNDFIEEVLYKNADLVMGLAVLPSRLKQELFDLADVLVAHLPTAEYPEALQKHAEWAEEILAKHPELNADNVHLILQDEVGHVFAQVLADAGVYKLDEAGRAGFVRFLESVK